MFVSFEERKLEKDIARGSKKALKKIDVYKRQVIDTGLVKCGRRYTFRTHIVDRPGGLSEVTRILTDLNANILSANMSKLSSKHGLGSQAVELTIETFDEKHKEEIRESIIKAGFEISD